MIGSPVNISAAGSFVPNFFSLASSTLEMSLSASALEHLTMHEFPRVLMTGRWSQYLACRSTPQYLTLSLAWGMDQLRHDRAHPSLE
jgi:hypothetical protein